MNRPIRTDAAPASFSNYAQAVETPAGARIVRVSGQVGIGPDGRMAEDWRGQVRNAFANVLAILDAAGMAKEDIVDVLVLLTDRGGVPIYREVRDEVFGDHLACSTLLICGLADPFWKVELTVTAARK